jgi:predicted nucleic acid-binding protein
MVKHFFDTYALIEIVRNNPAYVKFLDEIVTTTKFNLVELFYAILSERGELSAREIFTKFKDAETEITDEILFKAMLFRLKNKKLNLSYADCIGYVFAMQNEMKFLTGDNAFKDMENVEFVK